MSRFGVGLGGDLKSIDAGGDNVEALSLAVIQCRTRTLKRTGGMFSLC